MSTFIYTFRFPHHGRYSSYAHLADYLPDETVVDCSLRLPAFLPGRVTDLLTFLSRSSSERRLWRALSGTSRACVHYLYPENTLLSSPPTDDTIKLVLTCHQPADYLDKMRQQGFSGFFQGLARADAIVVLDQSLVGTYQELAPQARVVIIPHGVDIDFFSPPPTLPRGHRILTVGNWLRDYATWGAVVRAVRACRPDIEFTVIASPATLRVAQDHLGAAASGVTFRSGLSDAQLRDAYRESTVLFLPLLEASANNAILESMACGLPIVATDLPAVRDYVGDAAAALFHNADVSGIAAALTALADDETARQTRSVLGRNRAVAMFAWQGIAVSHRQLYSSLVS
jgi:glycosyltransferase involved in cell wall biosynthesis